MAAFAVLEEVALHLVGQLTDSHLAVLRSFQYPGRLLGAVICTVGPGAGDSFRARTVSAGPVVLGQPVRQLGRIALLLVMGLRAGSLLCWTVLTQTSTQCAPAQGHVSTQGLAEIRLEDQIYDGVVKGGGLGEDCCDSESHGRHGGGVAEGGPHGHDGVRAPRCEETDANCHGQLE